MTTKSFILAVVLTIATSLQAAAQGPSDSQAPSKPRRCSIQGTSGADVLVGGPGDDVICAGDGDDRVHGKGGDDAIYLGNGDDFASPGFGNDTVVGGTGSDRVNDFGEGGGSDLILGGAGQDGTLSGGSGKDRIDSGSDGLEWVEGGSGDDLVIAGAAGIIDGGGGDDVLFAASMLPVPVLYGTRVYGGNGNDVAVLLDGQHDAFVRGRNPLDGEPSVTIPVSDCSISAPLTPQSPQASVTCPLIEGVLTISLDTNGDLSLGGAPLDGLLQFRFSDLKDLRMESKGEVCICDPQYVRSPLSGDSIEQGA